MKKFIISSAVLLVALSSCKKKDYKCTCTSSYTYNNKTTLTVQTYTFKEKTKKRAQQDCDLMNVISNSDNDVNSTNACELK